MNYLPPKKTSSFLQGGTFFSGTPTSLSLPTQFPQATPHCLPAQPFYPIHRISTILKAEGKIFTIYYSRREILIKMSIARNNCGCFYKDDYLVAGKTKMLIRKLYRNPMKEIFMITEGPH